MESTFYTWRHPMGTKKLVWSISGYREELLHLINY